MPFYRRSFYRRSFYRRPSTFRKTYRKRIYRRRLSKYARNALRPEVKTLEVRATPAVNSGGVVQLLNAIVKGTTANSRIGNKVCNRALYVKGFLAVTPATGVDQEMRVMIIRDNKPNGVLPSLADILQNVAVYDFMNSDNNTRFHTLYDRLYNLNATAESGSIRPFKFFRKMISPTYYYDSANGDIRDLEENAYYIVALGTSVAGATAGTINYASKIYYTDT